MSDLRDMAVANARAEFRPGSPLAILQAATEVVRVATVIADTIDTAGMSPKDLYLIDELRAATDALRETR